ncbi:hypothetical protein KAW80_01285 [Candidatus Babeliales bacterium]|nr:hypothetical protein [Candidatus Babeliales bacterium]
MQVHLWIGQEENLLEKIEHFLKNLFCTKQKESSCTCSECTKIKQGQHPYSLIIFPQKNYYVIDDISTIFQKTSLSLNDDEKFFFIITKAEFLNPSCANRLLKILEEPPVGYNFILLSSNLDAVINTIRSRSLIKHFDTPNKKIALHPLLNYFTSKELLSDPIGFEQELKNSNLSEAESIVSLNELFGYISTKIIILQKTKNSDLKYLKYALEHLKKIMRFPPQPGGSNLFWKNLYLTFPK